MPVDVRAVDVDLNEGSFRYEEEMMQNDTVTLRLSLFKDKEPFPLSTEVIHTLVTKHLDSPPLYSDAVIIGGNELEINLTGEVAHAGRAASFLQLFDADGRVTPLSFSFKVKKDESQNGFSAEVQKTFIEKVVLEGPGIIQQARDVIKELSEDIDGGSFIK